MSNKLTFGKHEGRTHEWLFFNAPKYAEWIYENGIHRQEHNFDELERHHFRELYRRATSLGGTCCQCKAKLVSRMCLSTHYGSGAVSGAGFYCDTCEFLGGSCAGYYAPSFFVEAYTLSAGDQRIIVSEIRRHYLGFGQLTQTMMEAFFHQDDNFTGATAGFFERVQASG